MTIKEQVLKLHNKGLSVNQISKSSGLSISQVRGVYNKIIGLKVNRYDLIEPDNDLVQLIIGSILGDGSFTKPYKKNQASKLSIAHKTDQINFLRYKNSILDRYGLSGKVSYNKIISSRYKYGYIEECRLKSSSHPIFYYVRNKYYRDNKKGVYKEYVRLLDRLGLAIWYMDDGNVTPYSYQLNTQSFYENEKKLLQAKLRQLGIRTTLHKQGQIYILSESRNKFRSIIEDHIFPSMKYKLVPYNYRS